jgi:hypothetical protein
MVVVALAAALLAAWRWLVRDPPPGVRVVNLRMSPIHDMRLIVAATGEEWLVGRLGPSQVTERRFYASRGSGATLVFRYESGGGQAEMTMRLGSAGAMNLDGVVVEGR